MERTPDPVVTAAFEQQWHKLLLILMHKMGQEYVVITEEDIFAAMEVPGGIHLTVQELEDGIHLQAVSDAEMKRILDGGEGVEGGADHE